MTQMKHQLGTVADALSGILPGFTLGSIADTLTGSLLGSPAGALAASLCGVLLGGILGGIINPGKWLGALLGSIPGAVSGGAVGNVLGRLTGTLLLPGKWLGALLGGSLCSDSCTEAPAVCESDAGSAAPQDPEDKDHSGEPSIPFPAVTVPSIADLRHGVSSLLPGQVCPDTGDRGTAGPAAVSVISLLALFLFMGAWKKEEA